MAAATTRGGGKCAAFPDVCKVPGTPPVPTPFPNVAMCADAKGKTCARKVKILNKAILTKSSVIASSSGDEAGTLKGVSSSTNMDKAQYKSAVSKVVIEGKEIVVHLGSTGQNGSNNNAPAGKQVQASQSKVDIG